MTANPETPSKPRHKTTILLVFVGLLLAFCAVLWWRGNDGKQSREREKTRISSGSMETGRQSQPRQDDLECPRKLIHFL
jgi:hypothetical protein